jgi:hypothetical protein
MPYNVLIVNLLTEANQGTQFYWLNVKIYPPLL